MKYYKQLTDNSNCIDADSEGSTIAGGEQNFIDQHAQRNFIVGGQLNTLSATYSHSIIGGGAGNTVSNSCAVIAGGCGNTVSGAYSAILGGANNNDNGIPNTGIYANGLTPPFAVPGVPSSFWVDSLVSPNIPVVTLLTYPFLPPGTLYTTAPPATGFTLSPVYVA